MFVCMYVCMYVCIYVSLSQVCKYLGERIITPKLFQFWSQCILRGYLVVCCPWIVGNAPVTETSICV